MAGLHRLEADIAEAGGMWEFPALFDLEGNLVPAKEVEGQFGLSWMLLNERGRCAGWFNPSRARNPEVRRRSNRKKGYYIGRVRVPADADLAGENAFRVRPVALRKDNGWSPDAEIVDNGQWHSPHGEPHAPLAAAPGRAAVWMRNAAPPSSAAP
jgi:hypothetical protein